MALFCRIIQMDDLDEVMEFEGKRMAELYPDESERMFASWSSHARKEAMEHYIPMGWCFLARDPGVASTHSTEGALVGYFLAQPLLFVDGQTQSLWMEHLQHTSLQARDELCDLAYRLSREKNFQRVYFPQGNGVHNSISTLKPQSWTPGTMMVKTTKAL